MSYAFPGDSNGVITITLVNIYDKQYLLTIADNGIGIPSDLSKIKVGSLGMSLMKGLAEDIDGTFTLENNNGTLLRISFVHDMAINRMTNM